MKIKDMWSKRQVIKHIGNIWFVIEQWKSEKSNRPYIKMVEIFSSQEKATNGMRKLQ